MDPIVFGNVFSCEFSYEFKENTPISTKQIKVLISKYNSHESRTMIQDQLDHIHGITPDSLVVNGIMILPQREESNTTLLKLQNKLNLVQNTSIDPLITHGVMILEVKENQSNKNKLLQERLARLQNIIPDPDEPEIICGV
jgi:hypothetical protein